MAESNRRFQDSEQSGAPRLNIHGIEPDGHDDGSYYDGIGAELRAERLRCGLTLDDVSSRLRIRTSHLEAIEAGRFGDLPGQIYAIGFIRSYAEFLGADGDVCVSLFKTEAGPGGHSRKLTFPIPADESRRPGVLTIVVSLMLAGAVYGGWYLYQQQDVEVVELVPEVPPRFVEQAADAERRAEVRANTLAAANAAETPMPDLAEGAPDDLPVVGQDGEVPAEGVAENSGAAGTVPEPMPLEVATETAAPPATDQEAPAPAPDTVGTADGPVADAPESSATPLADVAAAPPPVPDIEPENETAPRVLGIANRDSRVIVRATEETRIMVRLSGGGTLLPSRILKPGDIYRSPDLSGVVLQSSNVGGLQIIVDGRLLGRADRLSSDGGMLLLDPDKLRSAAQ
ncbi:helix-turn-helix domain-containing protein [Minwuia sp.]|uniref:helix-turn-helix domain-containing protein n=1 Tax=Minwuia sp. TaxID=2493630 RepID=UPI003A8FD66B